MKKLLAAALVLGALFVWTHNGQAQEQGASTLEDTQGRKQEALSEIKQRLEQTEAQIEKTRSRERKILSELEESDRKLQSLGSEASQSASQVAKYSSQTKSLEVEIEDLDARLTHQRSNLAVHLRRLYRLVTPSTAEVILTSPTLTEASEQATYARKLAQAENKRVARYQDALEELKARRSELEATSSRLARSQADAKMKAENLRSQTEAKRKLLASIQQERHLQEQTQREMEQAAAELKALVSRLDKEKEADTKYTVETEREALARFAPFTLLKGRLPWPVEGKLIKPSGEDARLHKGIYIEAEEGKGIEAVAGGTVVFADYFRGYGNLCIIDHGASYHSLYAHARELDVGVGERVSAKQVIGRVGSSGAVSSPRLYFELRHRGRPVDPSPWMVSLAQ